MPSAPSSGCTIAAATAELMSESWLLALDSAAVIWLRLGRLAALDAAALAEGELMMAEKAVAAVEHSWQLMTGGFGLAPHQVARRSVTFYRDRVRANRRRLSRPASGRPGRPSPRRG